MRGRKRLEQCVKLGFPIESQQPVDFANVAVFFRIALIHIQYQSLEQIHLAGIPEVVALAVVRGVFDDDIYKKLGHEFLPLNFGKAAPGI